MNTPATSVKISQRVGAERGRQRDRGRVRAAAAERGHVVRRGRDALEAGDEHDLVLRQRGVDALGADLDDLRLGVRRVGDDAGLRAGERDGLVAEVVDRHRAERVRDPLAGRDEHVVLAWLRPRRHLVGQADQLVGRVTHRRQHRDDLRAGLARSCQPLRDALQLVGVADGRAAELHDDQPGRASPIADRRNCFEIHSEHLCDSVGTVRNRPRTLRMWVVVVYAAMGVGLVPWAVWLGASLRPDHTTDRWDVVWTGFDLGLALAFVLTALAAWRRSPWLGALAATSGTLLIVDAWFDIVLESHRDGHPDGRVRGRVRGDPGRRSSATGSRTEPRGSWRRR